MAAPDLMKEIVVHGTEKARKAAAVTMEMVREAMGMKTI